MKITPAHDFNDFEVGARHKLPLINILDAEARILLRENEAFLEGVIENDDLSETLDSLHGLSREEARKAVLAAMEARGLVETIEAHEHQVPHGDRSGVVIEPWLTDQWYVDAKTLAGPALAAVRSGETSFVPKNWEKTYFDWLENIQPWCISRQLWWGHQIPAWYSPWGEVYVAETEEEALADALADAVTREIYSDAEAEAIANDPDQAEGLLTRDDDVLDTWFSSGLWPMSTLGWPEEDNDLAARYPTDVLVTGFDIIFFWVARMMMFGLQFQHKVPFRHVYLHALVRDEKGAKMSKSKGNVIDPLQLIDTYGADALRFTLAAMAAQGRDIKLATSRVEGYRNFATKLWNASRFAEMNECRGRLGFDPTRVHEVLNRWIIGETARAVAEVETALGQYKFNEAAQAAYRFVWNIFCDWHLELAKPLLQGPDGAGKTETRDTVAFVLDQICKLLHPFMPFLTEEIWTIRGQEFPRESMLVLALWPDLRGLEDSKAEAEVGWVVDVVSQVRSVRAEMNVPAGAQIPLALVGASDDDRSRAERWSATIMRMARLSEIDFVAKAPPQSVQVVARGTVLALPLAGRDRLRRRTGAAGKGRRRRAEGDRQDRRQARQRRFPAPRARRSGRGAAGAPRAGGGQAGENVRRPENAGLTRQRVGDQLEVEQAQADRQRGGGPGGRTRRDERAHDLAGAGEPDQRRQRKGQSEAQSDLRQHEQAADRRFASQRRHRDGGNDGQGSRDQAARDRPQPQAQEAVHDELPGERCGQRGVEAAGDQRHAEQFGGDGRAEDRRDQPVGVPEFGDVLMAVGVKSRRRQDQDRGVDRHGEQQSDAGIRQSETDGLAPRFRISRHRAGLHDPRMQEQIVRHDGRADDAKPEIKHFRVAEQVARGDKAARRRAPVRPRQHELDCETGGDDDQEGDNEGLELAEAETLEGEDQPDVKRGDDRAKPERQPEQQSDADGCADDLGKIGGEDRQLLA